MSNDDKSFRNWKFSISIFWMNTHTRISYQRKNSLALCLCVCIQILESIHSYILLFLYSADSGFCRWCCCLLLLTVVLSFTFFPSLRALLICYLFNTCIESSNFIVSTFFLLFLPLPFLLSFHNTFHFHVFSLRFAISFALDAMTVMLNINSTVVWNFIKWLD